MNMESYDRHVGQTFDNRYRILKTIGVGGMAVVFEAYDLLEKRTVAVKMLKDDFASDVQQVKRFLNESRAVAMLSHPNIVKIYNISVRSPIKFIVMEYIEGITLKDYMTRRGVLSLREIISYSEQILHALEHAHAKGVIHRDIKPQNIMLLKNGVIKVMDFGIAKLPNTDTLTLTDKAIGTVYYISPEQAEGKAIDQRSDLYSLGVMMYEMSSGKLPFYDESPISVALMQIKNEPAPPRSINPNMPRGLEQIILSAMEKAPEKRFQSATQMLRQLARLKSDPNIVFKPRNAEEKKKKAPEKKIQRVDEGGRNRSMLPIILGVVSAFAVVLIVSGIVILNAFLTGDSSIITITVPNVVGYTYTSQDAVGLSSTYYSVEVVEVHDANSQKGQILSQYPEAGQKVKVSANKQRRAVTLTVSLGPETVIIENYAGATKTAAYIALRDLGFKVVYKNIPSDTVPRGKVCQTSPAAGESATVGSTVTVYLSSGNGSGTESLEIPKFIEMTLAEAKEIYDTLPLRVTIEYENSDKPKDQVIGQSLIPGLEVEANAEIILTVSNGKSEGQITGQSIMIDITGMHEDVAIGKLKALGLKYSKAGEVSSDLPKGYIVSQTIAPGDPVAPGERVYYEISNGIKEIYIDGYRVPNIVGMRPSEAEELLREGDYDISKLGNGSSVRGEPPYGRIVSISVGYDENGEPMLDYVTSERR